MLYTLSVSSSGKTGYMHEGHDKSVGIAVRGAQPTTLFSALPQEKGDQSGILHGQHSVQSTLYFVTVCNLLALET